MTEKEKFERFYNNFDIKSINGGFRELCWLFYSQGRNDYILNTENVEEIPIEDLQKFLDDTNFVDDVKYWIEHPESGTITQSSDGRVKVQVPCLDPKREKCPAWPDRCEECGGDGINCTSYVDLYKLCGVEPLPSSKKEPNPKELLTKEEIDLLANVLDKLNKFKETN